jgi:hypothetical protein
MEVKIESGIPLPQRKVRGYNRSPYWDLLKQLKVGDSFLYPIKSSESSTRTQISRAKKVYCPGIKLSYKLEGDNMIRVWRRA